MNKIKIVQFQAMPNDETYQGCLLGLCDKGVMYTNTSHNGIQCWEPFIEPMSVEKASKELDK